MNIVNDRDTQFEALIADGDIEELAQGTDKTRREIVETLNVETLRKLVLNACEVLERKDAEIFILEEEAREP